ncbi:MAG: M50 family metallopeptidase [Christensenellales bacterium]|jgi:regulator of sigma E protease
MEVINLILSVIGALVIIGVIIMVHEAGHFFAGRRMDIEIEEFSVGFGPKLYQRLKRGTQFTVRALPIGGYVRFLGEDENNSNPRAFNNRPVWRRLVTIVSGPLANIVFAVVLSVLTIMAFGDYAPQISEVSANSPAQAAGVQSGDIIKSVNGEQVLFYQEGSEKIAKYAGEGQTITLEVQRGGERLSLNSQFEYSEESDSYRVGVIIAPVRVNYGFFEAISISFQWMAYLMREMITVLGRMFSFQQDLGAMMGTVGIVDVLSQAVRSGMESVLRLGVLVSLNLGIVNLVPFPALDGGRILMLGIEKVFKRPLSRNVEGAINMVGLAVVLLLMLVLTYNDIVRLISGG